MTVPRPEREPLIPLSENHAQVRETIIFYYGHLLVGYLAAYTGTRLPFHATWLEDYSNFLVFAFVLGNMSILLTRLMDRTPSKKSQSMKNHLISLMFGFFFTLLVGIVLGLAQELAGAITQIQ